jgi:hypothetical protein
MRRRCEEKLPLEACENQLSGILSATKSGGRSSIPQNLANPIGLTLRFAVSHISRKTSEIWGTRVRGRENS